MPGLIEGDVTNEAYQTFGRGAEYNEQYKRMRENTAGMAGQYQDALGNQQTMFDQYGKMAAGGGPSLAQSQLRSGLSEANRAATTNMLQARGGNAAGAQAGAVQMGASLGGQAAMGAAQLRQQEQLAAMQAQSGIAGAMAGQGLQGYMGMEGMYQDQLANQLNNDTQYRLGSRQLRNEERQARDQRMFGMHSQVKPAVGEAAGAVGGLVGLSDPAVKQDVRPGNVNASQIVGELDPKTWEYQAGFGPQGTQFTGIMADQLEQVYPQAVADSPQGKTVNAAHMASLGLAASSDQEQRLRQLESKLGAQMQDPAARAMSAADSARQRLSAMDQGGGLMQASGASNATKDSYSLKGFPGATASYDPRKETYLGYGA